jgi:hypothetical protein
MTSTTLRRSLLYLLIALAGYLAVSEPLRVWLVPRPPSTRAKLDVFERTRDEYDAVFIGSSRIVHGLRPDVIDPLLSKQGMRFRSFNLAMPAMRSYEINWMIEQLKAMRPARLRYVLVEAPTWLPFHSERRDHVTRRRVAWHTPRQTLLLARSVLDDPESSLSGKASLIAEHLALMVYRQSNYGLGPAMARDLLVAPSGPQVRNERLAERSRGYAARAPFPSVPTPQQHPGFIAEIPRYEMRIASFSSRPGSHDQRGLDAGIDVRAMRHQRRDAEATGARHISITAPDFTGLPNLRKIEPSGEMRGVWDFARPDLHPELYAARNRYDRDHVNDAGATLWSRLVAGRLAELEEKRERP